MPEGTPPPAAAGVPAAPNPLARAQAPATGGTGLASAPGDPAGTSARGRIQMMLAMKMMEQAISSLGATSEDGLEVLQALTKLAKRFGAASKDVTRAEVKMMGEQAGAVQQPSPQQGQQFAQMIRQRQSAMGMGGAGAPPPTA